MNPQISIQKTKGGNSVEEEESAGSYLYPIASKKILKTDKSTSNQRITCTGIAWFGRFLQAYLKDLGHLLC